MLDQASESPPETEPLSGAELVHVYARPGAVCTVADDRGVCIELHVKVTSGDAFVASALGDRLRRGSRVSGRVYDGEAVQTMVFAVEEIEETGGGRADGLLRLIETAERGDERRDLGMLERRMADHAVARQRSALEAGLAQMNAFEHRELLVAPRRRVARQLQQRLEESVVARRDRLQSSLQAVSGCSSIGIGMPRASSSTRTGANVRRWMIDGPCCASDARCCGVP